MQEELDEQGYLRLRLTSRAPDPLSLGLTNAIVTIFPKERVLRLESVIDPATGASRKVNCIREDPNSSLLLEGQLHQGDAACRYCANELVCMTKNRCSEFWLNDATGEPPPGLFDDF